VTASAADSGGARVLVVDDNPMNRDLLARRVARLGHTVALAEHGRDAVTQLEAAPFDIVLLDIEMPELNGYEVLEWLKADPERARIPVIMISAVQETEDIARCIALGADDFLPKPFDPLLLKARLGASLARKRLQDRERIYAESLERELELGRRIQTSFLPDALPAPAGYEIAARFRAARQVSGDFYDAFSPPGRPEVLLVVGDVCGKGVPAALFMAVLRSLVRVLADEWALGAASSPDDGAVLLERTARLVNRQIAETHGATNMFATLFLGVLRPADGRLVYLNAGHDPPVLLDGAGAAVRLAPTGPAVGLLPGLEFQVAEARLEAGGLLCVHTDGVPESRSAAGALYGEARLLARLAATAPSADALLASVLADLDGFAIGAEPADDITLLAVRRTATG
jgi:serine phosphatase RsbU (regulator of sigma subunit)